MAPFKLSQLRLPSHLTSTVVPDLTDKIIRPNDQYCEAGGFGDVFRCRYISDDNGIKEVAVKAFRFSFSVDDSDSNRDGVKAARMIRRELGIWKRLDHRNIVPFLGVAYGFGRQGSASLVSMWMPHGTLHTFLKAHSHQLVVAHRLQLLLDIASGLQYLHSLPIIHGDLTSNNVLIDHNYHACLADFGCASLVGELQEGFTYLKMSTIKPGTLRWAAPEHFTLTDEQPMHTIKSDIYSFGSITLLVLSGKYPWSEVRADTAVVLRLSRGLTPDRPLVPPIDDRHWAFIERCWLSIPDRPLAEEVMSSLQQLIKPYLPLSPLRDALGVPSPSPSIRNSFGNDVLVESATAIESLPPRSSTPATASPSAPKDVRRFSGLLTRFSDHILPRVLTRDTKHSRDKQQSIGNNFGEEALVHQDPTPSVPKPPATPSADSIATENSAPSTEGRSDETTDMRRAVARQRFVNAIRSVIMLQATTRPMSPRRNPPFNTPITPRPARFPDSAMSLRGVRVTNAIDKLKILDTSQELAAHQALVRHLQFSPNGKYLATSSWDRTAVIFRVGESFTTHRILVHIRGFIGQVAWSPNGRILLTRITRGVKVWSEDGVCKKTIERQNTIASIIWLPTGDAFLSVEGSEVVKLNLHGKVLDTYHLGQVRLINVAISPDCCRLVAVGPSITPPSGPQPSRHTRVEKRIVVYNMQTKIRESQAPFANDVRDIVMARKTSAILISPEKTAPQLWKLEVVRDRGRIEYAQTSRLSLKHTFALKGPVDIAGPCHFGGKDDQFVLCASKGDVHIWDRETAALLHVIRPQNTPGVGDLTCIGWNYATDDPMMLATGSHDGTIRIYSTLDEQSDDDSYLERRTEGDRDRETNYSVHSGG